jgi:hypothetical protein
MLCTQTHVSTLANQLLLAHKLPFSSLPHPTQWLCDCKTFSLTTAPVTDNPFCVSIPNNMDKVSEVVSRSFT